ncbi:MAG: hypothetical protein IT376_10155 [Polyangiaceae bacterium]|nr:hypothetical protein [Polyangiaceae bacterium]
MARAPAERTCGSAVVALAAALALVALGCSGGFADRTAGARAALDARAPRVALAALNDELGVDHARELPDDLDGDQALLLLERAMVLQMLGEWSLASRDLGAADKRVELLDFSRGAGDELGRYLFSDDAGPYRAPAYEKLFVNTMNLIAYLARGDLSGARVEARRLAVMQRYLASHESQEAALAGAGSYLAGFAFERSGRPDEALRWYDDALAYGDYSTLREPIARLAAQSTFRSPRLRRLLEAPERAAPAPRTGDPAAPVEPEEPAPAAPAAPAPAVQDEDAELLVVVSFGRVPAKRAKRVPIGLALTYASGAISPYDHARADALAAQGLVTWVNFPELGRPRGTWDAPIFLLDGAPRTLEGLVAVDREAYRAWENAKGAVVGSAITRMITRVAAGEGARRAAGGGVGGLLASLGTQVALTAADTPDTRSWSLLPARIAVARVRLRPGTHEVWLGAREWSQRVRFRAEPRGWRVVALTVPR